MRKSADCYFRGSNVKVYISANILFVFMEETDGGGHPVLYELLDESGNTVETSEAYSVTNYALFQLQKYGTYRVRVSIIRDNDSDSFTTEAVLYTCALAEPILKDVETKIQAIASAKYAAFPHLGDAPFPIKLHKAERLVSFGESNPDRVFYLIRRILPKMGLLALHNCTLDDIAYARSRGYTPVVEYQTYKGIQNTDEEVGKLNIWDLYFTQPDSFTFADVLSSKHVVINAFGTLYSRSKRIARNENSTRKEGHPEYANPIRPNVYIQKAIDFEMKYCFPEGGCDAIAVYLRGTEFRYFSKDSNSYRGHNIQPSIDEVITKTKEWMQSKGTRKIIFATEDSEYHDIFTREFGERIISLPMQKVEFIPGFSPNISKFPYLNEKLRYHDMQYYIALSVLSKCKYYISGKNSGSSFVMSAPSARDSFIFDKGKAGDNVKGWRNILFNLFYILCRRFTFTEKIYSTAVKVIPKNIIEKLYKK